MGHINKSETDNWNTNLSVIFYHPVESPKHNSFLNGKHYLEIIKLYTLDCSISCKDKNGVEYIYCEFRTQSATITCIFDKDNICKESYMFAD